MQIYAQTDVRYAWSQELWHRPRQVCMPLTALMGMSSQAGGEAGLKLGVPEPTGFGGNTMSFKAGIVVSSLSPAPNSVVLGGISFPLWASVSPLYNMC